MFYPTMPQCHAWPPLIICECGVYVAEMCRRVGVQINALCRLKNILPCKRKEALYHAFILSPCGRRNIDKLERTNVHALKFVYNDTTALQSPPRTYRVVDNGIKRTVIHGLC